MVSCFTHRLLSLVLSFLILFSSFDIFIPRSFSKEFFFTLNTFIPPPWFFTHKSKTSWFSQRLFSYFSNLLGHLIPHIICTSLWLSNPSLQDLVLKIFLFSPFKCYHLIYGVHMLVLLFGLLLILTSITNNLCRIFKLSPRITLQSKQIFLYEFLITNKSIWEHVPPPHTLLYVIRCSYLFLNQVLAIIRSKANKNSNMNLPSTFTSPRPYTHAHSQNLLLCSLYVHLDPLIKKVYLL